MLNRFIANGKLSECKIIVDKEMIRSKFAIWCDNKIITCYYNVGWHYKPEEYLDLINLIPFIAPSNKGLVVDTNGKELLALQSGETYLMLSGTIKQSYDKNILFFAEYATLASANNESLKIELEGVFAKDNVFLNIVDNTPRVFDIMGQQSNVIQTCHLSYNKHYDICDNIIKTNNVPTLQCVQKKASNKTLSQKDIDNYMLEWEITNEAEKY